MKRFEVYRDDTKTTYQVEAPSMVDALMGISERYNVVVGLLMAYEVDFFEI